MSSNREAQRKALLALSAQNEAVETPAHASETLLIAATTNAIDDTVVLVNNVDKTLYDAFKHATKARGLSIKTVLFDLLDGLELDDHLRNPHFSSTDLAKRSFRVSTTHAHKLDAYTAQHRTSKRFVLEALMDDYLQNP